MHINMVTYSGKVVEGVCVVCDRELCVYVCVCARAHACVCTLYIVLFHTCPAFYYEVAEDKPEKCMQFTARKEFRLFSEPFHWSHPVSYN